ncbi:hypothetical protein QT972_14825 [Microcoleus sp. herbarium7]|uniref:hypothetical protein n=1 Tax=Microcoleus sp. herbarium7 TaxID=3055435 RepID=UPI002FD21683
MEEVSLEITSNRLKLSGDNVEYELHGLSVTNADFVLSEERVTCFKTSAEIADVVKQAALVTSKDHPVQSYINFVGNGEFGEIVVKATDGHKIYQKQLYALDRFDPSINFSAPAQLGKALSKLLFTEASWEIYQNFVKVTLDGKIEILATRSLLDYPDLARFEDKSQHITFLANPHELKSRLAKIKKDVTLWLYSQEEMLAIEYSEAEGDGHSVSWVKTQKQVKPAYLRVSCGLLMSALKQVNKTTKEMLLKLPKLDATADADKSEQIGFIEFGGNSYLIAGVRSFTRTPSGVRDWLVEHGSPIVPESQPPSTKARPVAEILNSRWNGKEWDRPELVNCECGNTCDSTRIERKNAFKLYARCPYCRQDGDLALERIDYKCRTCDVNNTSTEDMPISDPRCMNCGGSDFDTTHTFYCADCATRVDKENLKVCHCGSELTQELSWYCDECEETFQEESLSHELIQNHAEVDCIDSSILGFDSCPCCKSTDAAVEPHFTYHCETCENSSYGFHIPEIQEPIIECPECENDISDLPIKVPTDVFVVGSVTRF